MHNFHEDAFSLENRKLLNLALLLILALSLFILVSLFISRGTRSHDQGALVEAPKVDVFKDTNLIARAAIVYDVKNKKILYAKNEHEVYPLASITKVLTALTAVELLPKDTVVTIKKEFLDQEGDSGLHVNEKWNLSDLIDYSLMVSSNDGAAAIASAAGAFQTNTNPTNLSRKDFIVAMNATAKKIGMESSEFHNESGLDVSKSQSGGYGSAEDIAMLFAYALKNHPEVLSATRYQNLSFVSVDKIKHNAENTDTVLGSIPAVLGSKTGYTELAGGNLAVMFEPTIERPVVVVVLGSTYDGRFDDMKNLVSTTMQLVSSGQ